jgi:putative hydrolase of the HAD superfamily
LAKLKAVLFDLNGTLAYAKNDITETSISDLLFSKGYEISPQQLKAAWSFVSFIDYPKHGYQNWTTFLKQIFQRLETKIDKQTLNTIARLLENKPYQLYPDAANAVKTAKKNGFKTGIITTIARFRFKEAIQPIRRHLDLVMTGYEAGCDKSNPKMYKKALEILNVKPEEAIMIGDELPLDIELPKKLDMHTMLLDREGRKKGYSVDAFVYDLNEAMETIISKYGKCSTNQQSGAPND